MPLWNVWMLLISVMLLVYFELIHTQLGISGCTHTWPLHYIYQYQRHQLISWSADISDWLGLNSEVEFTIKSLKYVGHSYNLKHWVMMSFVATNCCIQCESSSYFSTTPLMRLLCMCMCIKLICINCNLCQGHWVKWKWPVCHKESIPHSYFPVHPLYEVIVPYTIFQLLLW